MLITMMRSHQFVRLARTGTEQQLNLLRTTSFSISSNRVHATQELQLTQRILEEHRIFLDELQFDWVMFYNALNRSPTSSAVFDTLEPTLTAAKSRSLDALVSLGRSAERWYMALREVDASILSINELFMSQMLPASEAKQDALDLVYTANNALESVLEVAVAADDVINSEWMNIRAALMQVQATNPQAPLSPTLLELLSLPIPEHIPSQQVAEVKPAPTTTAAPDLATTAPAVDVTTAVADVIMTSENMTVDMVTAGLDSNSTLLDANTTMGIPVDLTTASPTSKSNFF